MGIRGECAFVLGYAVCLLFVWVLYVLFVILRVLLSVITLFMNWFG